ncbi:YSIRK-type signal peptide-containing protein [Staphylococcus sp. Marseille-Q6910]|uniref:YSIRK-targeted triacylglycerol lipase n=1 Tax=Staphylococcus sp. Marseille-Q6910 TaxID=2937990 RepID=UPI00203EB8BC|nr:YSIRK-type signal peptide-containing protein [Staphylococcus sp. Marseille-Q6910]
MKKRQNKYSIRKYSMGAASILIGTLFFSVGHADAAETNDANPTGETQQIHKKAKSVTSNETAENENTQQNSTKTNQLEDTPTSNTATNSNNEATQSEQKQNVNSEETSTTQEEAKSSEQNPEKANTAQEEPKTSEQNTEEDNTTQEEAKSSEQSTEENNTTQVEPKSSEQSTVENAATQEEPKSSEQSAEEDNTTQEEPKSSEQNAEEDNATQEEPKTSEQSIEEDDTTEEDDATEEEPKSTEQSTEKDDVTQEEPKSSEQSTEKDDATKEEPKTSEQSTEEDDATEEEPKTSEQSTEEDNTTKEEPKTSEQSTEEDSTTQEVPTSEEVQPSKEDQNTNSVKDNNLTESNTNLSENASNDSNPISLNQLENQQPSTTSPVNNDKKEQDQALSTLKENAVATTRDQSSNTTAEATDVQPGKTAKQGEYKNEDPIILVHGFNGYTDDNNPIGMTHYWGGDKLNIREDLESNGYETHEASISAFGSNYDRAIELYYYIKGGTVDYGAAHAAKYGHDRYGKTYEGVYKDWQPGQKVHLVAHSMGGQTVRQLEELLRNGSQEEIEYQKEHGGEISPLLAGGHDNMVSSITTLATPHSGTLAADELGNEAFIRQVLYDYIKLGSTSASNVDFGLSQWGLKQREGESFIEYMQRAEQSGIWKTTDNALHDLTREGANELNQRTSLNPNIVYKTYTGESTHKSLFDRQKADLNLFFQHALTANVIGKADDPEWRVNDGLVSTISGQHPFNQAYTDATDDIQKGIWQVTPIKHNWDHVDFVGQDSTDTARTTAELRDFWHGIAEDLVKSEQVN